MKKVCVIVLAVWIGVPLESWSQVLHVDGPTPRSLPTDVGSLLREVEAQATASAWEALQKRPVGTKVRVRLASGAELEGQLREVRADAVVLINQLRRGQFRTAPGTSLNDEHSFLRSDVAKVEIVERTAFSATQKKFLWLAAIASIIVALSFPLRARAAA